MKRKWILVPVVAVFAAVLARRKETIRTIDESWPVNLAHRGASAEAPENTLEAFRLALESGAGGLELDVHMTRDGRVVVIHDNTVDRTTDGSGAVGDMTLDEILKLDAGYRFSPDGGRSFPYRNRGVRVPLLEEVFQLFPDTPVNVEIKEDQPGVEEAVLRIIKEARAENRVFVASQIHRVIRHFRGISEGRIPTSASGMEIRAFFALNRIGLEFLLDTPYDALQIPDSYRGLRVATPRLIRAAHRRDLRVDVWTVNDPARMRRLFEIGADVIITDRPKLLAQVLGGG